MTRAYSGAATEVLAILSHTEDKAVKKIPKKFLAFLKENSLKNYELDFDASKPINELNLSSKTEALLGIIFLKYWATEKEKVIFYQKAKEKELEYQKELNKKFNPDDIFKKRKINNKMEGKR